MRVLAGLGSWLLRGGIGRWLMAIVVLVVVGSVLRPLMGEATDALFGLILVVALLMVVHRLILGGGRRRR